MCRWHHSYLVSIDDNSQALQEVYKYCSDVDSVLNHLKISFSDLRQQESWQMKSHLRSALAGKQETSLVQQDSQAQHRTTPSIYKCVKQLVRAIETQPNNLDFSPSVVNTSSGFTSNFYFRPSTSPSFLVSSQRTSSIRCRLVLPKGWRSGLALLRAVQLHHHEATDNATYS